MKKLLAVIAASLYLMSPTANSQTITGAGATFPFPVYSKWSEAYRDKTNLDWAMSVMYQHQTGMHRKKIQKLLQQ